MDLVPKNDLYWFVEDKTGTAHAKWFREKGSAIRYGRELSKQKNVKIAISLHIEEVYYE